jgi:hypothetical protein
MSNFGCEPKTVIARKAHRCLWCWGLIDKGGPCVSVNGMWQGDWQNWRMHIDCYDASQESDSEIDDPICPERHERAGTCKH